MWKLTEIFMGEVTLAESKKIDDRTSLQRNLITDNGKVELYPLQRAQFLASFGWWDCNIARIIPTLFVSPTTYNY